MIKQPSLPQYTKDGKLFPNSNFKTDTYYKSQNLDDATKVGGNVLTNAIRKVNNSKLARMKNGHIFIHDIFFIYWVLFKELFFSKLTRKGLVETIEKMIGCMNFNNGFLFFKCDVCANSHIQPFTCKCRFCSTCGKKYRDLRSLKISKKLIDAPHRQFVFTIPKEFRVYFRQFRKLHKVLFDTVHDSFNFIIPKPTGNSNDKFNKKINRNLFGFISFLHTFGRDLKYNPHIHVLIAERYLTYEGKLVNHYYFHFNQLRLTYMYQLIKNVTKAIEKSNIFSVPQLNDFYTICRDLKAKYTKGFYVNGPKLKNHSLRGIKSITKYITRYASHPAISEKRIISLNHDTRQITWYYDPHEDDDIHDENLKKGRQYITEDILDFMKRLIVHVPSKHEHIIRYNGFYANNARQIVSNSLFTTKELKTMKNNSYWITGLLHSFGYSPLICDLCANRLHLSLNDSYFPKSGGLP